MMTNALPLLAAAGLASATALADPPAKASAAKPAEERLEIVYESKHNFVDTVAKLKEAAAAQKFTVLAVHEMSKTLAEKGFPREPVTVIEVCNAKLASQALADDLRIALMLPCPLGIWEKGGKVYVSTLDPKAMLRFYEGKNLEKVGEESRKALLTMLESVTK